MMEFYGAILDHAMVSLEPIYCFYAKMSPNKLYKPLIRKYQQQKGPNFRAMLLSWTQKGRGYDGKANVSFWQAVNKYLLLTFLKTI